MLIEQKKMIKKVNICHEIGPSDNICFVDTIFDQL